MFTGDWEWSYPLFVEGVEIHNRLFLFSLLVKMKVLLLVFNHNSYFESWVSVTVWLTLHETSTHRDLTSKAHLHFRLTLGISSTPKFLVKRIYKWQLFLEFFLEPWCTQGLCPYTVYQWSGDAFYLVVIRLQINSKVLFSQKKKVYFSNQQVPGTWDSII